MSRVFSSGNTPCPEDAGSKEQSRYHPWGQTDPDLMSSLATYWWSDKTIPQRLKRRVGRTGWRESRQNTRHCLPELIGNIKLPGSATHMMIGTLLPQLCPLVPRPFFCSHSFFVTYQWQSFHLQRALIITPPVLRPSPYGSLLCRDSLLQEGISRYLPGDLTAKDCQQPSEARRIMEQILPQSLQKKPILLTLCF